ncbi:MAG: LEA type 2 family protein [Casimicrobiaceae bacterium]
MAWRLRFGLAAVLVLALGMGGCASFVPRPLPPQVDVAGVRLVTGSADALRARVLLDVRNPNPFAVALQSVDARLAIEEIAVATAELPTPVMLQASGTTRVEVEARADLGALQQVLSRVLRKLAAAYDVVGVAVVQDGVRLNFRKHGDLPIADLLGRLR